MRYKTKIIGMFIVLVLFLCLILKRNSSSLPVTDVYEKEFTTVIEKQPVKEMSIAVVVCGNRTEETLVMMKSALLVTKGQLHFYIFADEVATPNIRGKLEDWQVTVNRSFSFEIRPVEFPKGEFQAEWRSLFKLCASQRLFLPALLRDVDSVLYVDTDTIFLCPVEQVWSHFSKMNESQLAALAPEHEDPNIGWYNRFAKHPYYKPYGVNTGVMLMNLKKMRAFGWESYITPIYKQYKSSIPWGDQDIINIIFSFHPDKLYVYGCEYNYRADHCMYSSVCKSAEREGIAVLHGSRGIFHNDKHPTFRSVYMAVQQYDWSDDRYHKFLVPLETYLNSSPSSQCGAVRQAFMLNIKKYIDKPP